MSETLRVELFPRDLDRSVDYYVEKLSFTLVRDERPRGERYVALVRGQIRLGLYESAGRPAHQAGDALPVELVLEVDDVDAERSRALQVDLDVNDEMTLRPWGLRDFRVLDPDGYYWRLTER